MEILRLVWRECGWKSVCENTSRNSRGRDALASADGQDVTGSKQMGKHHRMCGLHQDWDVCAVIRPHHRWLISRGLLP